MGQNIDYSVVEANVAAMKEIAAKICNCQKAMSYYCYGDIKTQGQFAASFEQTKAKIQSTVSDIEAFIRGYADVIDGVAQNFDALDNEMRQRFQSQYYLMA